MNDFDQSIQPNLPGFEPYPEMGDSKLPDFGQLMAQKLVPKIQQAGGNFDPHAMMIKKNQVEKGEIAPDTTPEVKWPEDQVKALEDFCKQYGIIGFKSKLSPAVSLAFLKRKIGGFEDVPLSERVPYGYERSGGTPTPNRYNPSFPYSRLEDKRVILKG